MIKKDKKEQETEQGEEAKQKEKKEEQKHEEAGEYNKETTEEENKEDEEKEAQGTHEGNMGGIRMRWADICITINGESHARVSERSPVQSPTDIDTNFSQRAPRKHPLVFTVQVQRATPKPDDHLPCACYNFTHMPMPHEDIAELESHHGNVRLNC